MEVKRRISLLQIRKGDIHMNITRAASIPLVLHDPYFSIWSSTDHLYDADPVHWCGRRQAGIT